MNFEKMNDKIIGERVKIFRKSQKRTQEDFCDAFEHKVSIDKFRLSAIENGKRDKRKNPHYLTDNYIEFFSSEMGISSKEFLFGNKQDRIDIIKLILLNVFMNGTDKMSNTNDTPREINPIFSPREKDKEFFRLAKLNLIGDSDEEKTLGRIAFQKFSGTKSSILAEEVRASIEEKLIEIDSFFFGKNYARYYDLLMDGSQSFAEQSSIMLKSFFGNFDFASDFLARCDNLENHSFGGWELRVTNLEFFYIDNYLEGKGNFAATAIDWKEISYQKFITAFNDFFELHLGKIYEFFDMYIFSKTLKILSNQYVNDVLGSTDFINLIKNLFEIDQFIPTRMVGHNYARAEIQKFFLIKKDSEEMLRENVILPTKNSFDDCYDLSKKQKIDEKYDLSRYLYDFENLTYVFANSRGGEYRGPLGLYAPTFFDISSVGELGKKTGRT